MSDNPDQADLHKAGQPLPDARNNVRPIAMQVPRVHTVLDLMTASVMRLNDAARAPLRCTTGHYQLDKITGGFKPGFTWLFGATTSWGKSSWLISLTDDNIRLGKRVLIVSSEDTEEVYGDRLMVRRSRVNALRYRDGKLLDFERTEVDKKLAQAEELPVFVDARRWHIEDLAGHLGKIIREHRIDLVAFDYIQEFRTKRRFQDERVKFKEIASVLRHVVKDAKCSGVLFSQVTTDENTKFPTRHNIRESRDIGNAAEVIALGFEPEKAFDYGGNTLKGGHKYLFVDKVKNGPRNRFVELDWDADSACFRTVTDPDVARIERAVGNDWYENG
jgi:replicative DNA helicase